LQSSPCRVPQRPARGLTARPTPRASRAYPAKRRTQVAGPIAAPRPHRARRWMTRGARGRNSVRAWRQRLGRKTLQAGRLEERRAADAAPGPRLCRRKGRVGVRRRPLRAE
jgi:hypothetical protein